MAHRPRLLACAGLAVLLAGCATFGTNVDGAFTCRAPEGTCAPTQVIDSRAAQDPSEARTPRPLPLRTAGIGVSLAGGVARGNTHRTAERTLRIVLPAHVDEAGTLHDEAVAWAVIDSPRWAAELRRQPGDEPAPPLMRALRRQLSESRKRSALPAEPDSAPVDAADPAALSPPDALPLPSSLASPLSAPSTAREAVAGATAPAAEGFDMSASPHDRTPRPSPGAPLTFPSLEAIEAARDTPAGRPAPETAAEEPR